MKLISEKNPLDVFQTAADTLYNAVAHTLGPSGLNTAVVYGKDIQANPKFQIINDGKTIIDNLTHSDAEVACALQTIRESVLSTNNIAGDGTTSTIILIRSMLDSLKNSGIEPYEICRQLRNLRKDILKLLPQATFKLGDKISLEQIAETSLGSNEYVKLFKEAYDFAEVDGEVLLEKSNTTIPSIEKIDGLSFNQIGFIPELALDESGLIKKELGLCKTIILKGDIKAFTVISNLLVKSKGSEEPIIMFYDRMSTDAFRLMAQNLVKGGYNLYPIALEGYGDNIVRYMKLINEIAGGKTIEIKENIDYNDPMIYGKIEGAIFNKDALIIKPIKERLEGTNKYIKDNNFHMSTKTAIIKAGANNSIALEEQYRRFEDAIHSCTNAIRSGVCLGGGLTYIRMAQLLVENKCLSDELERPFAISLYSIYNHLLVNCGVDNDESYRLPKLNEETGRYEMVDDYAIYDSYRTVEQVLINTIDMMHSIFSTKILICDPQR